MGEAGSQQFQVDLRGVVDLLSRHIYSSPRVYLRELLQNAQDAITARREFDGTGGVVRITPISDLSEEFVLRDDGIGLTADEMTELLATVGRSSKRDIFDLPRDDYLGQFGIGLLSCFMVADEIVIRSRSARGGEAVEWVGNTDGTFSVRPLQEAIPVGTSVHLRPRFDQGELLRTPSVLALAETFAEFLPLRINVDLPGGGETAITHEPPFLDPSRHVQEAMAYGQTVLGAQPFAMIPLEVAATGTRGVAYVHASPVVPGSTNTARVYLNRMLLGERVAGLLPDWAFFARIVVDSTALSPTASRESLVEDDALEQTRDELGAALRRWVLELGLTAPELLMQFVAIHEPSLKALALHDDEFAGFIARWLSVETTIGRMTIGDLVARYPRIRVAETLDEFRQVASITDNTTPLVNGGYTYDTELIAMLPALYPAVTVERVNVIGEFERLDPPPLDDRAATVLLEERATSALAAVDAVVTVRSLESTDVPAFYVADAEVLRRIERTKARGVTGSLWSDVLGTADHATGLARSEASSRARLCLNWAHPIVRSLVGAEETVIARTVHLLYVQALLAGQRPLSAADRELMTAALGALIDLSAAANTQEPQS